MLKLLEDIKHDIILYRRPEQELMVDLEEEMVQRVDMEVLDKMLVVEEVVDIVMEQ